MFRSLPSSLLVGGVLVASAAAAQRLPVPDDSASLAASRLKSVEARLAMQERIEAVNARFRASHGGKDPSQFGLQCCQITQIPASAFSPLFAPAWDYQGSGYLAPSDHNQVSTIIAPVMLPSGVEIVYLDLFYYDDIDQWDIEANLFAYTGGTAFSGPPDDQLLAHVSSGTGASGYSYVAESLSYTVNNNVAFDPDAAQLWIYVSADSTHETPDNLRFKAVDLWWMRQVSPAPATASFNDVPASDPAYPFIEALAASEITAGCSVSPPLYCPDSPLTRRQMAVFLAKALGLYWQY